jgi:hypothetical protein
VWYVKTKPLRCHCLIAFLTMTVGSAFGNKKKESQTIQRCQKCLTYGHWTYECKGERKFLVRPSNTTTLKKRINTMLERQQNPSSSKGSEEGPRTKKLKISSKNEDSDSSSSSSSSDSDSDSSDSDSDSSSDSSDSSSSSASSYSSGD